MSERRSTSAAALGWFSRTARHVGVILLVFGCDGSPGLQEGTDDPRTTGRAGSEPERQGSGPSEDLEVLPALLFLRAGKDPVHSVAFSPDGDIVAAGDGMNEGFAYRGKLYLWETRSGKLIRKYVGFRRPVERICFSDSGKVVAASPAFGGPVIVWEVGQEGWKAKLRAYS